MTSFTFTVKDPMGLHARPAGLLAKEAAKYASKITLKKGDKSGDAKRIFNIISIKEMGSLLKSDYHKSIMLNH